MILRYTRWLSLFWVIFAAAWIVLASLDHGWWRLVVAVVALAIAWQWGRSPAAELRGEELVVRTPGGRVQGRYRVDGPADLRLDRFALVHVPNGERVLDVGGGVRARDLERWREWLPRIP